MAPGICPPMTGGNSGDLFVTNVLNGTVGGNGKNVAKGTIVRVALDFSVSPPG